MNDAIVMYHQLMQAEFRECEADVRNTVPLVKMGVSKVLRLRNVSFIFNTLSCTHIYTFKYSVADVIRMPLGALFFAYSILDCCVEATYANLMWRRLRPHLCYTTWFQSLCLQK